MTRKQICVEMPMYHPSKHDLGSGGGGGGGDGRILDLETAVKDGVLGGDCGGGGFVSSGNEKLDLKKMITELESSIDVPSVFICPISLEPMQDPVTLCTGQTYERSNILKWFSLGHLTCPTTMQELWDDSVTPNKTLHQLIYTWFSQKYLLMKKRSEDFSGRALEFLETLRKSKGQARIEALKGLRRIVEGHVLAKKIVVENGGIALISSLLGPFTSHLVGSESVGILVNFNLDSQSKKNLMQPSKMSLMVDMLNEGSFETKINCTKLITNLIEDRNIELHNVSSLSLLVGLLRLVKNYKNPNGVLIGLTLLKLLCSNETIANSVVKIGAIPQLIDLLPNLNSECLESSLKILENLSKLQDGKFALKDCSRTIPNLVKLLMRVSENCTELALSILWVVCNLAPEECALTAVDAGLAAKLLLVIQSGCNPALKQRSAELLKLCSLNYSTSSFISKCKLTRTIQ